MVKDYCMKREKGYNETYNVTDIRVKRTDIRSTQVFRERKGILKWHFLTN